MPPKDERTGKRFQQLLEFQADSLAEFLHDTRTILKSENPEIALYMNGGVRGANWATGRLNRVLIKEQDLLGSEGGFLGGDLTNIPLWKPGLTARLLETQAGDKPRVIFSAASHKPWTFSLLPDPGASSSLCRHHRERRQRLDGNHSFRIRTAGDENYR